VPKSREDRNMIFGGGDHDQGIERRDVMASDFDWEVPIESVPIPSEGKVYPQNSSMYGRRTINIKAMTAKEEDILSSRALINNGTVIKHLIRSCVIDDDVDVDDMLVGDRNALMISIRITGYGVDYSAFCNCPACGNRAQTTFNLGELPIKRLELDPVSPGENCFEYTLPVSKKSVLFKFLTGRDDEVMDEEAKKMRKLFPDREVDNVVTRKLRASIISIDGVKDKSKVYKFIENMPALDSRKLRQFILLHEPGIDTKGNMTCSSCGKTSEVSLPMGASFFWPAV